MMFDVRTMFEYIRFYEQMIKEHEYANVEKAKEHLIERKRELRRVLKEDHNTHHDGALILNHGGEYDTRWTKLFYPGVHWSDEEKREYIEENWVECPPSLYDCTGAIFTWAIDVFDVPKGTVVYIREAMDV